MLRKKSRPLIIGLLVVFIAMMIFGLGFPINRLVAAVKASDERLYTMISIHMACNLVLSPVLDLLLILIYVYVPCVLRKLLHGSSD